MSETALERFIRYVGIDTQSKEDVEAYPSTDKQFDLLQLLLEELDGLGLSEVRMDEYGYVTATIPPSQPGGMSAGQPVPTMGLIAHVDTSPSFTGANVKPQVIRYAGGDVVLPGD